MEDRRITKQEVIRDSQKIDSEDDEDTVIHIDEGEIFDTISECYSDLKKYTEENSLELLDKSSLRNFANFLISHR